MSTLARRLKAARTEADLKQTEVAQRTGIKRATLANWEIGRTEPDSVSLKLLAEFYGVSGNYLLGVESNKDSDFILGKRLTKLRKKMGLSQEELSRNLNIFRGTYAHYEIGKRHPDFLTLRRLADFFNTTTDYLLGRTNNPVNPEQNKFPDLEAPLREKNYADALLKISELAYEFDLSEEMLLGLLRKVHNKYGPIPKKGGMAANGLDVPGSLSEEDLEDIE